VRCCCWPAEPSQGQQMLPPVMEADQGWRLSGIEVADDSACDLPVELLKSVGLGVDRGTGCAGPEGAVLRFLDHKKDVLHGPLQGHYSGSGGRDAAPGWASAGSDHKPKDLPHNRHHLLQLRVVQSADRMGASAPGPPVEGFELLAEHVAVGTRPFGDGT